MLPCYTVSSLFPDLTFPCTKAIFICTVEAMSSLQLCIFPRTLSYSIAFVRVLRTHHIFLR